MTQLQVRQAPGPVDRRGAPAVVWLLQAVTGALVLVLVTVHMIANHFVVDGGLRTYAQVVDYVRNPLVFIVEVTFLLTVTLHALLGVRSVLLDRGPAARTARRLDRWLLGIGVATVTYGLAVLILIAT